MMFCRYSLKNPVSPIVTTPGKERKEPVTQPVTSQFDEAEPSVPLLAKPEIVTVFGGGPPSVRSNARSADTPAKSNVSTVIWIGEACAWTAMTKATSNAWHDNALRMTII